MKFTLGFKAFWVEVLCLISVFVFKLNFPEFFPLSYLGLLILIFTICGISPLYILFYRLKGFNTYSIEMDYSGIKNYENALKDEYLKTQSILTLEDAFLTRESLTARFDNLNINITYKTHLKLDLNNKEDVDFIKEHAEFALGSMYRPSRSGLSSKKIIVT